MTKLVLVVQVELTLLQQELTKPEEANKQGTTGLKITVKGGAGGHSGMDIHKGIANANKLINRVLLEAIESVDIRVSEIHGGGLRNAIPREAHALIVVSEQDIKNPLRGH